MCEKRKLTSQALTLEALRDVTLNLARLPVWTLYEGAETIKSADRDACNARGNLQRELRAKYRFQIDDAKRLLRGKAGTARTVDSGYAVIIHFPEVVEWDQEELRTWVMAPKWFMTLHCTVTEEAYKQCTPQMQAALDEARTVKVGEPIITIEPLLTLEAPSPSPCTVLEEQA